MLRAVDEEVSALLHGRGLHATHVRAGVRFAHGETFGFVAAHGGQQVALALLAFAGKEDVRRPGDAGVVQDRKSTRLNSSHGYISYAVFCLKKKKKRASLTTRHQSTA